MVILFSMSINPSWTVCCVVKEKQKQSASKLCRKLQWSVQPPYYHNMMQPVLALQLQVILVYMFMAVVGVV